MPDLTKSFSCNRFSSVIFNLTFVIGLEVFHLEGLVVELGEGIDDVCTEVGVHIAGGVASVSCSAL